jgi:phage terminase large subunit-like protein
VVRGGGVVTTIEVPDSGIVVPEKRPLLLPGGEYENREDELAAAIASSDDPDAIEGFIELLNDDLRENWRSSPAALASTLTGGQYKRYKFVEYLSRKFVDAATGKSPRQIWNLPSRLGKTTFMQWGMTWVLDHTEGRAKMILVSWGDELARRTCVGVRDIARSYDDRLRFHLTPGWQRQDEWSTNTGGGLFATGIDGGMYGFGAGGGAYDPELEKFIRGGIVVDDPFKNWQAAHSGARRDHVENQFKGVIRNRLDEEDAWIIVVGHRLHPDDIWGRLQADMLTDDGDRWEVVALPALAYDDGSVDPIGRAPGEPLEPEKFPLSAVLSRARGMTQYLANAQEQQRPQSEKGNEILREWFVISTASELPSKPARAITSWDLKLKDREAGDYVVGGVWWTSGDGRWLVDMIRGQYDHATTACAIALLQVRHPEVRRNYVEAAGSADEVIPELQKPIHDFVVTDSMAVRLGMSDEERAGVERLRRAGMGNIKAEPVTQAAKPIRARTYIAPVAEQGNLRLSEDLPALDVYLDEMAAFPNGSHDDTVDMTSQALKVLAVKPGGAGMATATGTIPQ